MRLVPLAVAIVLILTISTPSVQSAPKSKIIAMTVDPNDKKNFKAEGCEIVHELIDATALDCPEDVSQKHIKSGKAIRDDELSIVDLGANTQIGAINVWADYTGAGVTVAVLDTGVDYNHIELSSSTCGDTSQPTFCGKSFVAYTTSIYDDNEHGTHVSGIITSDGVNDAQSKGAAPDARVWMGKVCKASGLCYASNIAKAIEFVALNNVSKIMSISLGGGGTKYASCDKDYIAKKVNWAVTNYGITAVIAAGNSGGTVSSPGCASKAIAVGAVNNQDVRASWSGSGKALDIVAPGVGIYSTLPGNSYASFSGTSMATPHVAATIALMKQKNPSITDSQIKNTLYGTAQDLGVAGWDNNYGWGRVDAYAAVNATP